MIALPVYNISHGRLRIDDSGVYILDRDGAITWVYKRADHGSIGIAACPRSATMYTTKILKELGYDIGHEKWARDGSVGYHLAAVRPSNCLHQVRNPLYQISSMMSHKSWGFSNQLVEVDNLELLGCMQHWLGFNELLEEFCVWRYQIEQLQTVWDEFLDRIGHKKCDLPDVPLDMNKSKNLLLKLDWADLFSEDIGLAQSILDKAVEYGYDVPKGQNIITQSSGTGDSRSCIGV